MNKIIVITGPTSVGKTALSIAIAKKYDGEIINADSMQFYKGLNIGTAKIKEEEKEGIPHHLFDINAVDDEYSIYHYQKDARIIIEDIQKRHKTPILVGGTGLYLKAALYDYQLSKETQNSKFEEYTNEELYKLLTKIDQNAKVDPNNRRRLIRALSYYQENNKSISQNKTDKLLYDTIFIGLTCDRNILYDRINQRVDIMVKEGLIDEVRKFYDQKIYTKPLINGIGYKELYQYFDGKITLDEAIDLIKKNSRHYAKRQYTFFNHQMNIKWFNVSFTNFNDTIEEVIKYIDSNN
mgnify:FL=1